MSDSPQAERLRIARKMQAAYKERVRRRLVREVVEVDSMMEQVATYLQKHRMSTAEQIRQEVGLERQKVLGSLDRLKEHGIVGSVEYGIGTERYFLK